MRLRILSDLHLEFGDWEPPAAEADVLILAGDTHRDTRGLPWIEQRFSRSIFLGASIKAKLYQSALALPGEADAKICELFASEEIAHNPCVQCRAWLFLRQSGARLMLEMKLDRHSAVDTDRAFCAFDPRDRSLEVAGTAFQPAIGNELRRIPEGETRSYADISAAVGKPKAVRAAGSANSANNIAVFIPCHRVIRTDGTLGGDAQGLERKEKLLSAQRTSA